MAGASLAIGTASAVSGYGAKQQDYASQIAYNRAEEIRRAQERYDAEVARNYEWNQIGQRQLQERDAAVQAMVDNQIRAISAAATAEASAADNGVEGNSIESVARNFYREQGRIDAPTERNLKASTQQLQEEKKASEAKRLERSSFTPLRQPTAPSLLSLGLEIGGAAVNAYSLYDRSSSLRGKKAVT